jgi:hypothetical protein
VRKHRLIAVVVCACAMSALASAQAPSSREISPRITRLETWLWAITNHTPGVLDEPIVRVNAWNQEQLRFIWMEVNTLVAMIRDPSVDIFFVTDPPRPTGEPVRSFTTSPARRSRQVFYTVAEQRRLQEIVKGFADRGTTGPENVILKRGAMLHADIAMAAPAGQGKGNIGSPGRRLMDRVRPAVTKAPGTVSDPGHDDTVRLWYLASGAFMAGIRQIELNHYLRAIELFPDDPEILMSAAAIHESFAGVRTQSAIRKANIPRDVDLGVRTEGQELRLSEQLYKRALEADPKLLEARIRLGRVLGLRGRHEDAVEQLRQGVSAAEPLLQYYAHLFLAAELEGLGNGEGARQSYQRAAALFPTAQSPLLGLSRVASQLGDVDGARDAIGRVLKLPADEEREDPWWAYEIAFARTVNELLADLREAMSSVK